jgi:hypothetical protein
VDGLRSTRAGRSRSDGSVNEGEAQGPIAGSWGAAVVWCFVFVDGGGARIWSTGRRWFGWLYGGGEDVVVGM